MIRRVIFVSGKANCCCPTFSDVSQLSYALANRQPRGHVHMIEELVKECYGVTIKKSESGECVT